MESCGDGEVEGLALLQLQELISPPNKVHTCKGHFKAQAQGQSVEIAENRHGLVSLYKDMEACAEYADILVMWEMIHSSSSSSTPGTESSKRPSHHRFRFRMI
ncbi:hypothetical protein RJ640_010275 [Escallonia rubra]|uniref:Uncharacterized protein n=1 Tax=Escallonia rubra TaxID=112253 RepID=A0AA88U8W4_9ASTE|nr:hypothetical protein RJ640_010275 [Escallonia rubra]